jgi:hypothetical protein
MTSAPPPPGWRLQPVIPATLQQAQDTLLRYLTQTLRELPAGTKLDATRYRGATSTAPCRDTGPAAPPEEFSTIGDLQLPPGADPGAVIARAGETWASWGWYVVERDGFYKPNRFGYAPDGYSLHIMARYRPGLPPSLEGVSPCFPGDLPDDRSPFPSVITTG